MRPIRTVNHKVYKEGDFVHIDWDDANHVLHGYGDFEIVAVEYKMPRWAYQLDLSDHEQQDSKTWWDSSRFLLSE